MEDVVIRNAEPNDCEKVFKLIMEQAVFENVPDEVSLTPELLKSHMFAEKPWVSCVVASKAEDKEAVIGYTMYHPNYCCWNGPAITMEALYVSPDFRGKGIGRRLWQASTQAGLDMGVTQMCIIVNDWNKLAKDMYKRAGAVDYTEKEEYHMLKLEKHSMEELVKKKL